MNPWRWVRARRWWVQLLIGLAVLPPVLVAFYVAVRSIQYGSAEKDAGAYVPSTANVVVRARELERHVGRIRESTAWRVLQKKILKDPVLRRLINEELKAFGAPTLDELDDDRKPFARNLPRILNAVGTDAVATLQVRESLGTAPFCAIVRLRWLHYLATPFARLVLPTEQIGGETCLVLRLDRQELRVAFAGALAIVSNDRALLEQALKRKGREEESERPVAARVVFEGSPGLLQIRKALLESGLCPYVKWETVRGMTVSGDLRDSTMGVDVMFDGAEPLHLSTPPLETRSWAPPATTGYLALNTGGRDLITWLRQTFPPGSKELGQNVQDALQALEDGGLSAKFLPELRDGMAVLTGVEELEGQALPCFTLILPSKDPKAAVDALNALVLKIAGTWGDSKYFTSEPAGGTTVYSWSWPRSVKIADLAVPTYAALKDSVVVGSNKAFTMAVIRSADQGDGLDQTSTYRKFATRLKELGFSAEPSLASGFLFPPQFREALNGSLSHVAKLTTPINSAALRAEVEAELRRQGRPLTDAEIVPAYNEAFERKIQDQESAFRRVIQPMEAVKWCAFEASQTPKGISLHSVLELR